MKCMQNRVYRWNVCKTGHVDEMYAKQGIQMKYMQNRVLVDESGLYQQKYLLVWCFV